MNITITISDAVAGLALIVAVWSVIQTSRFNKRQNTFAETAERLNRLLIERESSETQQQLKADVGANFVKVGKSNTRLKVFNRGMATARNIRMEILAGEGLITNDELSEKFPIPTLERHQAVEVMTRIHFNSPRRIHIRLHWDDGSDEGNNKELWLDVF